MPTVNAFVALQGLRNAGDFPIIELLIAAGVATVALKIVVALAAKIVRQRSGRRD